MGVLLLGRYSVPRELASWGVELARTPPCVYYPVETKLDQLTTARYLLV